MRTNTASSGLPQGDSITWSDPFDVLLRKRPTRLDRIEVGRVRRQIFDASMGLLDQRDKATIMMRLRVV